MDKSDFDDFMREKLENRNSPPFKQTALNQFHERMSSFRPIVWHQKYRTELFVATSLILFTLINGSIIWFGIAREKAIATTSESTMKRQIDSLMVSVQQLKNSQKQSSTAMIDPAVAQETVNKNQFENDQLLHTNPKFHLRSVSSLPKDVYEKLPREGVPETKNGDAYLTITDTSNSRRQRSYTFESGDLKVIYKNDTSVIVEDDTKIAMELPPATIATRLSSKVINKIEDHQYSSGLGINVAPHIDFVKGVYQQGNGNITPRVGFTADWVFSPRWSVETSLDYMNTRLTVYKDFQSLELPNVSTDLGDIESAQITTSTLSLPINFKYRWWLTRQYQLVLKTGYTPYLSFRSQYLYSYPYPGRPVDSDLIINTSEQVDQRQFYGNTFLVSAGITKSLKKKRKIETSLFYEKSLGHVGSEKLDMQLFGIRTALWFTIR